MIGCDTTGLAVAQHLASNTSVPVVVIEAGDFYGFSNSRFPKIPAYMSEFTGSNPTQKNHLSDWYMYTKPQPGWLIPVNTLDAYL